jgi:hypothetical protein
MSTESNINKNVSINNLINNDEITTTENQAKKVRKLNKDQFGLCKVCNSKATGIHYGVASCEGCKVNRFILILKIIQFCRIV